MTNHEDNLLREAFHAGAENGYLFGGEGEALTAEHLAEQFTEWNTGDDNGDSTDIGELDLLVRALNVLRREGIDTVGDLRKVMNLQNFNTPCAWDFRNFGLKCWEHTTDALRRFDETRAKGTRTDG